MADLEITIGGRAFSVACQEGEEHFLRSAALMLDAEAQPLLEQMGRLPEGRMLLMAGLMLADRTAAVEDEARRLRAKLAEIDARPAPRTRAGRGADHPRRRDRDPGRDRGPHRGDGRPA